MAAKNVIHGHKTMAYTESREPTGRNLVQTMGHYLWGPMVVMGIMIVAVSFILALVRASIATDLSAGFNAGDQADHAMLGELVPGVMFLGIGFILGGISLAIARILGVFRVGGGSVQQAVGQGIKTPIMPITAKIMLVGMMMAMMLLMFTFGAHIYAATEAHDAWSNATRPDGFDATALGRAETWSTWLGALRLFAVGLYLTSIAFGLATITNVIRFQTLRVKEMAAAKQVG